MGFHTRTTGLRVNSAVHSSQHCGGRSPFFASDSLVAMKALRTSSDHAPVVPPSIGPPLILCFFFGFAFIDSVKARATTAVGNVRKSAIPARQ